MEHNIKRIAIPWLTELAAWEKWRDYTIKQDDDYLADGFVEYHRSQGWDIEWKEIGWCEQSQETQIEYTLPEQQLPFFILSHGTYHDTSQTI